MGYDFFLRVARSLYNAPSFIFSEQTKKLYFWCEIKLLYAGSTAQAYAEKYDREFVALEEVITTTITTQQNDVVASIWGDVNCSGQVDISDAILCARFTAEDSSANITADDLAR